MHYLHGLLIIATLYILIPKHAESVTFFDIVNEEWSTWKLMYNKRYETKLEDKFRFKIFMENKAKIAKHNALAHRKEKSYFLQMNRYGDLLHEEFKEKFNGYNYNKKFYRNDAVSHISPANVELPRHVDWREHGAVTEVKNQSTCGSCYAFSATGALEGQHFRKTGRLIPLSEQNIVDCSKKFGNDGCDGGLMDNAFRYIKINGGVDTEESYPYNAEAGMCRFNKSKIGATDKGYVDIPFGNEDALKAAVATIGPVSAAIDAGHYSFQFYSHGIYHEEECNPFELSHAILIVGYGRDQEGDYWIIKNSWGTHWGHNGYIKMQRNVDNHCGIATAASYPLV